MKNTNKVTGIVIGLLVIVILAGLWCVGLIDAANSVSGPIDPAFAAGIVGLIMATIIGAYFWY